MKLNWKSYGDTGRTAKGDHGTWVIVTDGAWWHLNLAGQRRGKFTTRQNAESHAQDRENGVPITGLILMQKEDEE